MIEDKVRKAMQKEMSSRSTKKEGYIFWLNWSKVDESWNDREPKPFNYYEKVNRIS